MPAERGEQATRFGEAEKNSRADFVSQTPQSIRGKEGALTSVTVGKPERIFVASDLEAIDLENLEQSNIEILRGMPLKSANLNHMMEAFIFSLKTFGLF